MRWCVEVRATEQEIEAAMVEADNLGREIIASVSKESAGTALLMFRMAPRGGGGSPVRVQVVDRDGYLR